MFIVHVFIHVKNDRVDDFIEATRKNAMASVKEPGIARFDVIRQMDNTSQFVLVEVYRTSEDPAKHKETIHYQEWRDAVEDMMAEPRKSIKFSNVFPDEEGWD